MEDLRESNRWGAGRSAGAVARDGELGAHEEDVDKSEYEDHFQECYWDSNEHPLESKETQILVRAEGPLCELI